MAELWKERAADASIWLSFPVSVPSANQARDAKPYCMYFVGRSFTFPFYALPPAKPLFVSAPGMVGPKAQR
jgi:hypothetical protein